MKLSRRALLGTGSLAAATGLAGCIYHGPFPYTRLEVSVREPFDAEVPTSIPVSVDVFVQGVNSRDATLHGVELVCFDVARRELASKSLGEFAWREADPDRRESTEHDTGWFTTVTTYSADWTVDVSLEVDAVPEWLTVRVADVWFDADDRPRTAVDRGQDGGRTTGAVVGTARASSPPPEVTVSYARLASERPDSGLVEPNEYQSSRLRQHSSLENPFLPRPAAARLGHRRSDDRRERLGADLERFVVDSPYAVDPESSELRRDVVEALDDHGDSPHVVELSHTIAADVANRRLLSDQRDVLGIDLDDAIVSPVAEAGIVEDRIVGVPCTLETVALLYDREHVEEPPETVAELLEIAAHAEDTGYETSGIDYSLDRPSTYAAWVYAFGGYYYDAESDSVGLTGSGTVRGIEFVAERLAPQVTTAPTDPDDRDDAFVNGNVPFAIAGPDVAARAEANGIDVGVATLPKPADADYRPRPFVRADLLSFTSALENPEERDATAAAVAFAEWYVTNEEVQVRNADEYGTVPASAAVADSDELPESAAGFVESATTGTLEPPDSTMRTIYPPLQAAFESVLAGDRAAETALEDAEAEIEGELSGGPT
ncbi:extracellular solute-binding protein [Natrarchaeobius sp. A-rgal3]|uniref:extracellular solute-binding protein n=1 Tax=Natrarchaeobius versutus TaxID=1679078 RepID=UPI00350F1201